MLSTQMPQMPQMLKNIFVSIFKIVVVLAIFHVSFAAPRKVFGASSLAVLQANPTPSPASPARGFNINLFGKTIHFDSNVGTLGLVMALVLAALFSITLFLALIARRRARQGQTANQKLRDEMTERKRAEKRFRLVVEAAPNAMIMVDERGRMTRVNNQAEQLFGYTRDELLDQPGGSFSTRTIPHCSSWATAAVSFNILRAAQWAQAAISTDAASNGANATSFFYGIEGGQEHGSE